MRQSFFYFTDVPLGLLIYNLYLQKVFHHEEMFLDSFTSKSSKILNDLPKVLLTCGT